MTSLHKKSWTDSRYGGIGLLWHWYEHDFSCGVFTFSIQNYNRTWNRSLLKSNSFKNFSASNLIRVQAFMCSTFDTSFIKKIKHFKMFFWYPIFGDTAWAISALQISKRHFATFDILIKMNPMPNVVHKSFKLRKYYKNLFSIPEVKTPKKI